MKSYYFIVFIHITRDSDLAKKCLALVIEPRKHQEIEAFVLVINIIVDVSTHLLDSAQSEDDGSLILLDNLDAEEDADGEGDDDDEDGEEHEESGADAASSITFSFSLISACLIHGDRLVL